MSFFEKTCKVFVQREVIRYMYRNLFKKDICIEIFYTNNIYKTIYKFNPYFKTKTTM